VHLIIWVNDEGITDQEFKDGDIFQVKDDSFAPGSMETKRWLVVKMEDYAGPWDELVSSEFGVGAGNDGVVRRMRKYRLNYAPKLTPEELIAAKDRDTHVDIITDRYTLTDIVRK